VWQAPWVGVERTWKLLGVMVDGLGQLILGRVPVSELGGPLRIAKMSGESLTVGPDDFIGFIALISINLGFINLLPVPVLDGGHLLFYGIEAIRRRPVEPQVMEWAFRGGLMAILALMLFVTFNDLGAFGLWRNLAGLIG
jgi:regulator of sigma E protease